MVKNQTIVIGHIYPEQMNVYGDTGNVLALNFRLEKRGIKVANKKINSLQELGKSHVDILVGGGGQDSNQSLVKNDIRKYSDELLAACSDGLVCLMVCGMYQLFGHYFLTAPGEKIPGAGVFDMYTEASNARMIGNVKVHSKYGTLVGFENHSGNTYLASGQAALGSIYQGYGNNGDKSDESEGARVNNVFGTYLHGPILPKNPKFADELILRALDKKYGTTRLSKLDDDLEHKTAEHIRSLKY